MFINCFTLITKHDIRDLWGRGDIKMVLEEMESGNVERIHLAQDRVQ
jgi:hypothetical protein